MARQCIFCGGANLTVEDAIPLWVSRLLLNEGDRLGIYVHQRRGTEPPQTRDRRTGKRIEVRVKQVCGTCNNGWMSALEAQVQPILTPMLLGQSVTLSESAQRVIARWAVKTAVVFHYGYPASKPLPEERLQQVRRGPEPPVDSWVWAAPSTGTVQPAEYEIKGLDMHTTGTPADEGTHGELFTLCVGQLAVQVFSVVLDDVQRTINLSAELHPVQIGPTVDTTVSWPPAFALDDDQLEQLFVRFTPGASFPFNRRTRRRRGQG
jgi:hypothetical protein